MARAHFVKKARKDNPVVKAGESYYWWKFRHSGKKYSKTRPRQSQLTQSEFMGTYYSLLEHMEDELPGISHGPDFEAFVENLVGEILNLADETQDKLYNMPDQLQEGDTGQLMQERIDELESWISELEGITVDEQEEEMDDGEREEWASGIRDDLVETNPGI